MPSKLQIKDKSETDRLIKITSFRKDTRKTEPHKHNNYFEIIYLSKGSGYHYIDSRKYPIEPPIVFFIRKEQVHYWELDQEPEGFVIIIKKLFIQQSLDNELKSLFEKLSSQNSLRFETNKTIQTLFELLTEENKTESANAFHIIEGLLKSLLAKVLEVAKPVMKKEETRMGLFHSFLDLLHEDDAIRNKVNFYAKQLNTSPQNLNMACRKAIAQSASEVLAEFIISEARRLLLYTDKTVAEISYLLEFYDPSHFVKYFKKNTGHTPQVFRSL